MAAAFYLYSFNLYNGQQDVTAKMMQGRARVRKGENVFAHLVELISVVTLLYITFFLRYKFLIYDVTLFFHIMFLCL